MKKKVGIPEMLSVVAVASLLVLCCSARAGVATSWDAADSSTGGGMKLTESGSAVTITFPKKEQANSLPTICDLLVGGSSPESSFTGNLSAYSGIRFKITGDGHLPKGIQVAIRRTVGRNRREWVYSGVGVTTNAGEWTVNLVPLIREKAWTTVYNFSRLTNSDPDYWWGVDMSDVEMIIIRISSLGMDEQSYSIDQFQLIGENGPTEPAVLTPVEDVFGVSSFDELSNEQKVQDSDGDGMSDLNEVLAGMDPHDKNSVFASTGLKVGGVNKVNWQGVLGGKYSIWRYTSLSDNDPGELIGTVTASITGVISFEDPSPVKGKPNFYKIVKY